MLSARSRLELGRSTLVSTAFLERRRRVHVVQRDQLLFDTTDAAPAQRATDSVHLFAQLTGTQILVDLVRGEAWRLRGPRAQLSARVLGILADDL